MGKKREVRAGGYHWGPGRGGDQSKNTSQSQRNKGSFSTLKESYYSEWLACCGSVKIYQETACYEKPRIGMERRGRRHGLCISCRDLYHTWSLYHLLSSFRSKLHLKERIIFSSIPRARCMAMLRREHGHVGNGLGDNGSSLLEEWC